METRKQFLSDNYKDSLNEDLLNFVTENTFFDNELVKAYYSIYFSIKEGENEQSFLQLAVQ